MLNGRQVLLVGSNYTPEPTGIAPYTTALAEYLAQHSSRVRVVTGLPHYPKWEIYPGYRSTTRRQEEINGVEVVRVRHFVPRKLDLWGRARFEASFFRAAATQVLLREPAPTVIVGVSPNLGAAAAAAAGARRFSVPLALVIQDLVGPGARQSGIEGGGKVSSLVAAAEGRIARSAAAVAIVAEPFRDYLQSAGVDPERIQIAPNWTHVSAPTGDRSATRRAMGWRPEEAVVLHAGNIGKKQALHRIIPRPEQLRLENGRRIRIVFMGDGNERQALLHAVRDTDHIQVIPPVSAEDFPDVLHAADYLLVHERASVRNMSLPSKITSYAQSGRPIIAAVPERGATAREIDGHGIGVVIAPESPADLVKAVKQLEGDPEFRNQIVKAGAAYRADRLQPGQALQRLFTLIRKAEEAAAFARSAGK